MCIRDSAWRIFAGIHVCLCIHICNMCIYVYTCVRVCAYIWKHTQKQTHTCTYDVGALAKGTLGIPEDQQVKEDQDQGAIQALFSFTSSLTCAVLETPFGGSNQGMIGRVLLCWTL